MKKLVIVKAAAAALVFASCALAGTSPDQVSGESLDSGLGALPSSYTAKEFMKLSEHYVAGEKQDSGLGNGSKEEIRRIVAGYESAALQR